MKSTAYATSDTSLSDYWIRHIRADESDALSERVKELIGNEPLIAFAQKCGVKESTLRNIIKSAASPRTDNLVAIADAANVSIEWLATGRGPKQRGAQQQQQQATPPAASSTQFTDVERLSRAIAAVQEGLASINRTLPPKKHAELIEAAYELITQEETNTAKVIKLIRLAA